MDAALVEPRLKRARRRLALRRFLLGRTHRATGDAYYQAGTLYRLQGEVDAAARCLAMAERIHRQRLGPGHPAVALDLISIGEYQAHWGERRRAVASYEKAERILDAHVKKDPDACYPLAGGVKLAEHLALLLCDLGAVHRDLEQPGKARTCLEKSLGLTVREYGAGSDEAARLALHLVALGVDPLPAVREAGGEPAASALAEAFRRVHGFDPAPEPIL